MLLVSLATAAETKADEMFLELLRRYSTQGRNVSEKPNAPTYAPAAFAKEADARRQNIRKPDFEAARRRLFASNKLPVENYGRPSRPASKLTPGSSPTT